MFPHRLRTDTLNGYGGVFTGEEMTQMEIYAKLIQSEMPGFILGLDRSPNAHTRFVSHIYRGPFSDPGEPMCPKGWNRFDGESYSIWRNNLGKDICRNCLKAVEKELDDQ